MRIWEDSEGLARYEVFRKICRIRQSKKEYIRDLGRYEVLRKI